MTAGMITCYARGIKNWLFLPTSLFFSIPYAGLYILIYFLTGILLSDKSYCLHEPLQIFC